MTGESAGQDGPAVGTSNPSSQPSAVERASVEAELVVLQVREKARTDPGDAVAASRRRGSMVEVGGNLALTGPDGPITLLDACGGRGHGR